MFSVNKENSKFDFAFCFWQHKSDRPREILVKADRGIQLTKGNVSCNITVPRVVNAGINETTSLFASRGREEEGVVRRYRHPEISDSSRSFVSQRYCEMKAPRDRQREREREREGVRKYVRNPGAVIKCRCAKSASRFASVAKRQKRHPRQLTDPRWNRAIGG